MTQDYTAVPENPEDHETQPLKNVKLSVNQASKRSENNIREISAKRSLYKTIEEIIKQKMAERTQDTTFIRPHVRNDRVSDRTEKSANSRLSQDILQNLFQISSEQEYARPQKATIKAKYHTTQPPTFPVFTHGPSSTALLPNGKYHKTEPPKFVTLPLEPPMSTALSIGAKYHTTQPPTFPVFTTYEPSSKTALLPNGKYHTTGPPKFATLPLEPPMSTALPIGAKYHTTQSPTFPVFTTLEPTQAATTTHATTTHATTTRAATTTQAQKTTKKKWRKKKKEPTKKHRFWKSASYRKLKYLRRGLRSADEEDYLKIEGNTESPYSDYLYYVDTDVDVNEQFDLEEGQSSDESMENSSLNGGETGTMTSQPPIGIATESGVDKNNDLDKVGYLLDRDNGSVYNY